MSLSRGYRPIKLEGEGEKLFRKDYKGFRVVNRVGGFVQLSYLAVSPSPFVSIDRNVNVTLLFTPHKNDRELKDRMYGPRVIIFARDDEGYEKTIEGLEKATGAQLVEV